MGMTVELVAMARLGEVFISRDDRGRLRRHSRYLPGEPMEIGESEAEWAISHYDYDRIGESFGSWPDLAARVEDLVPRTRVPAAGLRVTPEIATAMLPRLRRAAASDDLGEKMGAQRVLLRLIGDDGVLADEALRAELLKLLTKVSVPGPTSARVPANDSRMDVALQYYSQSETLAA